MWERRAGGVLFIPVHSSIMIEFFPISKVWKGSSRLDCSASFVVVLGIWVKLKGVVFPPISTAQEFHIRVPSPYDLIFLLNK